MVISENIHTNHIIQIYQAPFLWYLGICVFQQLRKGQELEREHRDTLEGIKRRREKGKCISIISKSKKKNYES